MDKLVLTGVGVASLLVGYKAGIYLNAHYQLKKARQQTIVDLNEYSDKKTKLEKEKEK